MRGQCARRGAEVRRAAGYPIVHDPSSPSDRHTQQRGGARRTTISITHPGPVVVVVIVGGGEVGVTSPGPTPAPADLNVIVDGGEEA